MLVEIVVGMKCPCVLAKEKVIATTVCDVSKDPSAFDNKFVRLKATLAGNFEMSLIVDPDNEHCRSLWFTYPGGAPATYTSVSIGGPEPPRPSVQLNKDRKFLQFQRYVDAEMYPTHRGWGCTPRCVRYEVTAVMVGLVEFGKPGHQFGHMNAFPAQFVLQSIEQSSVKDLSANYDAANFATKPTRFPTGYLSGTLIGPAGRPVPDADLNIYSANDPPIHIEEDSATSDARGRFKFSVPPGDYVIGFNTFWVPSPKNPFPPTYYPSTQQRSSAKIVSVADNQHVRNLVLTLPQPLSPRRFRVKILWPDGKPVGDANVWLSQVSEPTAVVGISVSHTGTDGTFDLIGFEGTDYILHASKYSGLARVSCAPNALIRASEPVALPIQLSLTITDFGICNNTDFEVPPGATPQP